MLTSSATKKSANPEKPQFFSSVKQKVTFVFMEIYDGSLPKGLGLEKSIMCGSSKIC